MGRRLTGDEMRQGMLEAAATASEEQFALDHSGGPSEDDQAAAQMTLEALGRKAAPSEHLRGIFKQARTGQVRTQRSLDMLPYGSEHGMARSGRRFTIDRRPEANDGEGSPEKK